MNEVKFTAKIKKQGNSLVLILPKDVKNALGLEKDDFVDVSLSESNIIVFHTSSYDDRQNLMFMSAVEFQKIDPSDLLGFLITKYAEKNKPDKIKDIPAETLEKNKEIEQAIKEHNTKANALTTEINKLLTEYDNPQKKQEIIQKIINKHPALSKIDRKKAELFIEMYHTSFILKDKQKTDTVIKRHSRNINEVKHQFNTKFFVYLSTI